MADAVERAIREAHEAANRYAAAESRLDADPTPAHDKQFVDARKESHAAIDRLVALVRLETQIAMLTDWLNAPGMERWQIENDISTLSAEAARLAGKEIR